MTTTSDGPAAVVHRFYEAYNAFDFDAMTALLHPDVHFAYFNKGIEFHSAADLVATLRRYATDLLPDRQMGPATRESVDGDTVYAEHLWSGTLAADAPGFGTAGQRMENRICSILVVRDGLIVDYVDYG